MVNIMGRGLRSLGDGMEYEGRGWQRSLGIF